MLLVAFSACAVTILAIFALRPLALSVDLVAERKGRGGPSHRVPVIGGLAMFIGLVAGVGLIKHSAQPINPLLAVCGLMLVTGLLEDRYTLSHSLRVLVRLVGGVVVVGTTHLIVRNLGDPFGTGGIVLAGTASVLFTIVSIAGSVALFQARDGMDGLTGLNALATLVGLSMLAWDSGHGTVEVPLCLILGSAIAGFTLCNGPFGLDRRLRCPMGDAGSTFIGMAIGWLAVATSQIPLHDGLAHPSYVLWMVALPLFELWSTFMRRTLAGRSPFAAKVSMGLRASFMVFLGLDVLLVGSGLLLAHFGAPDWFAFALLVVTGFAMVYSMDYAHHLARWLAKPMLARAAVGRQPARATAETSTTHIVISTSQLAK